MERSRFGPTRRGGFTLIELLVVITIITLLVAILLPALASAKKVGKMIREQAAAKEQTQSWINYTYDHRNGLLIPYVNWLWAHPQNPPGQINMLPRDTLDPAHVIEGDVVKVWTWRFVSHVEYPAQAMQLDANTASSIGSRVRTPTGSNGYSNLYDDTQRYQYAFAWHPSLGINSVYVGGHYRRGAFVNGTKDYPGHPRRNQGGHFYVSKIDDIQFADRLMVYTSARSVDVATSDRGTIGYGGNVVPYSAAVAGRVLPGYYEVLPPRTGFPLTGGSAAPWVASNKFDKNSAPVNWGCVDFRHFDKAVSAMTDGHVTTLDIPQLRDMRRWSNYATDPNWIFENGP